jgi:hypothetical protein
MKIESIHSKLAMALVMEHHYSQRVVGCTKAFGLFENGGLVGCCCFSIPASYTLCKGVCGDEFKRFVWELSRLVVTTKTKNAASFLIGQSLRLLDDRIVVSYADCNDHVGHVGYVYQATNWIYTGHGNAEPKWVNPNTGDIVSFTRRHIDTKAEALGMDWRELEKVKQVGKHRYVTFTGTKAFKRRAKSALKYKPLPYPKGETKRPIFPAKTQNQGVLF